MNTPTNDLPSEEKSSSVIVFTDAPCRFIDILKNDAADVIILRGAAKADLVESMRGLWAYTPNSDPVEAAVQMDAFIQRAKAAKEIRAQKDKDSDKAEGTMGRACGRAWYLIEEEG